MGVAPGGIGLPNFNKRIGHRSAIFFQHPAGDDDPFPDGFPAPARIGRQITVARLNGLLAVNGTGEFGKCLS
jgi:hypothetical protein